MLIVLIIFGLKFALFFAVFIAVLNLIPYIGNLVAIIFVALFTLLTKDNVLSLLWIMIGLFVVNFLQDYIIRPLLMGNKLRVNAFVVFLAVILVGFVWGVSGMILFIPIVGVVKIALEQNENWAPFAVFFSDIKKSRVKKLD
jgi:predicted PurR-regulated permease PerM